MQSRRIHISGASGAGVTHLGRIVADALALPHHDTDDYFWMPTDPPYRLPRARDDRLRLMREMFLDRSGWVLTGALDGWGDSIRPLFDLIVFVVTPWPIRDARLRDREQRRFGAAAVAPGGWRWRETENFLQWAAGYDQGEAAIRSRTRHEAWLAEGPNPVLRLDGGRPPDMLAADVCSAVSSD